MKVQINQNIMKEWTEYILEGKKKEVMSKSWRGQKKSADMEKEIGYDVVIYHDTNHLQRYNDYSFYLGAFVLRFSCDCISLWLDLLQ